MTQKFIQPVSNDSVRLTTDTVEKRLFLAKQEISTDIGLKHGLVVTYDGTARTGTATIDGKSYPFRAVSATIAVGDTAVFQRLVNLDRGYILLGVVL